MDPKVRLFVDHMIGRWAERVRGMLVSGEKGRH
jgi:hypothetical protein